MLGLFIGSTTDVASLILFGDGIGHGKELVMCNDALFGENGRVGLADFRLLSVKGWSRHGGGGQDSSVNRPGNVREGEEIVWGPFEARWETMRILKMRKS